MSKKMEYDEFIKLAKQRYMGFYEYSEETEKSFNCSHSIIPVICPRHGKFFVMAKNHLKYKCKKCSYEERALMMRSNSDKFIEKAKKIHGDKYDYSKVEYKTAKKDKVCIICPKHGEFWQLPNDHLSSKGCPRCNDSHLEREIMASLGEHHIQFEIKKHFDWLGRQEIDVFLPDYGVGIECQGKQHFGIGGWSPSFDFSVEYEHDKRKNELCLANNVKLIYYIDKKFSKELNNFGIYNSSNVFYDIEKLISHVKKEN